MVRETRLGAFVQLRAMAEPKHAEVEVEYVANMNVEEVDSADDRHLEDGKGEEKGRGDGEYAKDGAVDERRAEEVAREGG